MLWTAFSLAAHLVNLLSVAILFSQWPNRLPFPRVSKVSEQPNHKVYTSIIRTCKVSEIEVVPVRNIHHKIGGYVLRESGQITNDTFNQIQRLPNHVPRSV